MDSEYFINEFSRDIWKQTYKHYKDDSVLDTWKRVAKNLATVEENPEEWEKKFLSILENFKFVPGGRILSNAGTEWKASYINCFVKPRSKIHDIDSLDGILKVLRDQAQTLKSEGGWGCNFSFIRPRGSFIHGIGVETPGAVKYMELFDKSSDIITAGSGEQSKKKEAKGKIRKGAQMGIIDCWHPDVLEFISAKQTEGRLSKFNISVGCYDDFMIKVVKVEEYLSKGLQPPDELDSWNLIFPDTQFKHYKDEWYGDIYDWMEKGYPVIVHKTVKVSYLWNLIMQSSYNRNDPGVLFLDVANRWHCWNYGPSKISRILECNPCFSGDTKIAVADGRNLVSIKQLAEEGKDVPVYSINPKTFETEIKWGRNPRITGTNEKLLRVWLDDNSFLDVTPNHKFITNDGRELEAKDLKKGDSLPKFVKDRNEKLQEYIPLQNESILEEAKRTGLNACYDRVRNQIVVKKICEISGKEFITSWSKREICYAPGQKQPKLIIGELQNHSNEDNLGVSKIEELDGTHVVYNITIDDNHTVAICNSETEKSFKGIYVRNCGEQLLPDAGCCNLGSLNLTQFVTENGNIDFVEMERVVRIAVRFLDNVNSVSYSPLEEYKTSMEKLRRIGLGVMGWGSLLFLLKIPYGTQESREIQEQIMQLITSVAIDESINLAIEKGPFEYCELDKHWKHEFFTLIGLKKDILNKMKTHGIRNSSLFSIQPTGNTGILANNVSGGLEPIFMHEYIRTSICPHVPEHIKSKCPKYWEGEFKETEMFRLTKEGTDDILLGKDENGTVYKIDKNRGLTVETLCEDYAVNLLKKRGEWDPNAEWAKTATQLSADRHIFDMEGFAKYLDSAISKTLNIPFDYPYEDYKSIYLNCYKTGFIRGFTTYREGTMTSVLKSAKEDKEYIELNTKAAPKRPKVLPCEVHCITAKGDKYIVVVGLFNDQPYEIFGGHANGFHIKKSADGFITKVKRGQYSLEIGDLEISDFSKHFTPQEQTVFRMASTMMRHGIPLEYIVEQMQKSSDDIFSLPSAISRVLKKYIKDGQTVTGQSCPECGEQSIIYQEGCKTCKNCGWTACG